MRVTGESEGVRMRVRCESEDVRGDSEGVRGESEGVRVRV